MKRLATRLKPKHGFSYFLHLGYNILLPILMLVLVRANFFTVALLVVLLGKWRMLAVRPRHWPANIRANAIDIIVGVALLIFMGRATSGSWQMLWAAAYGAWLIFLKPNASSFGVTIQALLGQLLGFMALFLSLSDVPLVTLMVASWAIAYASARHFFSSFDEPLNPLLSYLWALFAAGLVWVLGHWLLFYGPVAQPTVILSFIGYGLATLYYLKETDRLSTLVRRELVVLIIALILIIVAFSDWKDKAI